MTEIQFLAVVAKMRQAQRKFFALQSSHPEKGVWLKESCRIEAIIDAEIKRRVQMTDADLLKEAYAKYAKDYTPQLKLAL